MMVEPGWCHGLSFAFSTGIIPMNHAFSRRWMLLSVLGVSLALLLPMTAAPAVQAAQPTQASQSAAAPQARVYFNWVFDNIAQTRGNLATITQSAEAAAAQIVAGKNLGIQSPGIAEELGGRAGGFYMVKGARGKPGDIILYPIASTPRFTTPKRGQQPQPLDEKTFVTQSLDDMLQLKQAGSLVIAIVSVKQLDKLGLSDQAKNACDFLIDTHAPASDGLLTSAAGQAVVPTYPVANAITAWTWSAELYSALTRLGKTPAMYQSVAVAGARARNSALKGKRFDETVTIKPIDAGVMAKLYLDGVEGLLQKVSTTAWPSLAKACDKLDHTLAQGGKVYVMAQCHYPPHNFGNTLITDPDTFTIVNKRTKFIRHPGEKDAILVLGYCMPPGDPFYGDPAEYKNAGQGAVWIITSYDTKPTDLGPKDIMVDQFWQPGDAVVPVPGYDVRILPPSGVITEAIGWAITAQVYHDQMVKGKVD
jgi:uncharacterized phosphosugar-binding protein